MLFQSRLADAVNVQGAGDVALYIRLALLPVEDQVARDRHDGNPQAPTFISQYTTAFRVYAKTIPGIKLGVVDSYVTRRVDDGPRPHPIEKVGHRLVSADVEVLAAGSDRGQAALARDAQKSASKRPIAAGDENHPLTSQAVLGLSPVRLADFQFRRTQEPIVPTPPPTTVEHGMMALSCACQRRCHSGQCRRTRPGRAEIKCCRLVRVKIGCEKRGPTIAAEQRPDSDCTNIDVLSAQV